MQMLFYTFVSFCYLRRSILILRQDVLQTVPEMLKLAAFVVSFSKYQSEFDVTEHVS